MMTDLQDVGVKLVTRVGQQPRLLIALSVSNEKKPGGPERYQRDGARIVWISQ